MVYSLHNYSLHSLHIVYISPTWYQIKTLPTIHAGVLEVERTILEETWKGANWLLFITIIWSLTVNVIDLV